MIRLIRKKIGLKFLELRYPENVVEEKGFDMVKIYSFRDFLADGWVKEKQCTMMISLDKQIEELWVNIKDKYRKHIATERNKGVIVKKITNEEKNKKVYTKFYKELYIPLCKRENMKPYPLQYLSQGDLWYAEDNKGEIVSGSIIFHDDTYATQSFAAPKHIEYNGHRSLIWAAIKFYKEAGLKWFNFGGGESDYKRRFGSQKFDVWTYVMYLSQKARIMNSLRDNLSKIGYINKIINRKHGQ